MSSHFVARDARSEPAIGSEYPHTTKHTQHNVLGVFGFVLGLLNRAYQLGEASHVAVFEYTIMIFGPFFAWWLLSVPVTPIQMVGIAMIAAAGIIIAVRTRDA